jgi:hypothetical protein
MEVKWYLICIAFIMGIIPISETIQSFSPNQPKNECVGGYIIYKGNPVLHKGEKIPCSPPSQ